MHLDVKLGFLVKVRHWSSRMLFGYPMIVVIVLLILLDTIAYQRSFCHHIFLFISFDGWAQIL